MYKYATKYIIIHNIFGVDLKMIIMGIDPGFAITGYGIVKYEGNRFASIDYGAVTTDSSMELPKRMLLLYNGLTDIIKEFRPEAIAIEELFFNKNTKTALNVGHGRGVAVLAAAQSGIDVFEYTPLQVKQAVVGYGRAEKAQVQQMIKVILNLSEIPKPDDVADALAVAVCHGSSYKMASFGR
jgi:crossover junction endodeoxyribonuclease RuvC